MRYVDTTELLLKRDQWGNGAELWKDDRLKKDFKECFCGKCWYSEVLLIGQDVHIDHFRPKGEVKAYGQFSFFLTQKGERLLNQSANAEVLNILKQFIDPE